MKLHNKLKTAGKLKINKNIRIARRAMRKENPGNAFQYTCPIFDIQKILAQAITKQKSRTCTTTK